MVDCVYIVLSFISYYITRIILLSSSSRFRNYPALHSSSPSVYPCPTAAHQAPGSVSLCSQCGIDYTHTCVSASSLRSTVHTVFQKSPTFQSAI